MLDVSGLLGISQNSLSCGWRGIMADIIIYLINTQREENVSFCLM